MTTWGNPSDPPAVVASAQPWSDAWPPPLPPTAEELGRWRPPLAADGRPLRQPGIVTTVRVVLGVQLGFTSLTLLVALPVVAAVAKGSSTAAGEITTAGLVTIGSLLLALIVGVPAVFRFGWNRFGAWTSGLVFAVLAGVGAVGVSYEMMVAPAREGMTALSAMLVGMPWSVGCLLVEVVLLLLPSVRAYSRGRS